MPRSIHSIGLMPNITLDTVYTNPAKIKQAERLIKEMPEIQTRAFNKGCTNFGKMLTTYIRRCIKTNTPPKGVSWPPHSDDYLKRYDVKGFWQLSGQMLKSIRLRYYQNNYYVGPEPNEMVAPKIDKRGRTHTANLTLIQLARVLELGSEAKYNREGKKNTHNDIPPRPLFVPSFKAVGGTNRLKRYLIYNLQLQLKPYL